MKTRNTVAISMLVVSLIVMVGCRKQQKTDIHAMENQNCISDSGSSESNNPRTETQVRCINKPGDLVMLIAIRVEDANEENATKEADQLLREASINEALKTKSKMISGELINDLTTETETTQIWLVVFRPEPNNLTQFTP